MSQVLRWLSLSVAFAFVFFLISQELLAEPWLAARYAQNCAACHAPARENRPFLDRRCTLSCQGCHVNPNGGGIRNRYGNWNQERWLKSFNPDLLRQKKIPAPLKSQLYFNGPSKGNPEVEAAERTPKPELDKKYPPNEVWKTGYPLVVTSQMEPKLEDYDRSDGSEHRTVNTLAEFARRVTQEDPLRDESLQRIYAGGDFRYIYYTTLDGNRKQGNLRNANFPMAFDLGARLRPMPNHLSAVVEARFLNGPTSPELEQQFTSGAQVRSAYLLVDDIPGNTFAMYGLYRPMFGNMDPDHTSLSQRTAGFNQRTVFKAFSVGSAPNVPFVNLHIIRPPYSPNFLSSDRLVQSEGYAVNVGGRWVTLGANFTASYWNTTSRINEGDLLNEMFDFNGGFILFDRYLINIDALNIKREFQRGRFDIGQVFTVQLKERLWREIYAIQSYVQSNTAPDLKRGSANEIMAGFKGFLITGTELETLWIKRKESYAATGDIDETLLQVQAHVFY